MQRYKDFRPTGFDCSGLALPEQQEWFVAPCGQNRDSDILEKANFITCLEELGGESDTVEVHQFGHWACGWFEIIICDPKHEKQLTEIESALEGYPILDEDLHSEMEHREAGEVWENCYDDASRVAYMRENFDQFEFRGLAGMLSCARGKYFAGCASDLLYN